jgi:hypothetical protein
MTFLYRPNTWHSIKCLTRDILFDIGLLRESLTDIGLTRDMLTDKRLKIDIMSDIGLPHKIMFRPNTGPSDW